MTLHAPKISYQSCSSDKYREVQLDFIPEIGVFYILFERCYTNKKEMSFQTFGDNDSKEPL